MNPVILISICVTILLILVVTESRHDLDNRPTGYVKRKYPKGKKLVYEDKDKKVYEENIVILGSRNPGVKYTVKKK